MHRILLGTDMTHIERARLKPGKHLEWQGRHFAYKAFSHKAHHLKELNVSALSERLNETVFSVPVYEHLSQEEILNATIEGLT